MATVQDPVCGMDVATDSAAAKEDYQGQTYYFCSTACQEKFRAAPQTYVQGPQPAFTATNGAAAAAVLTVGIGSFVLGLLTTLAAASGSVATVLAFYGPVGPLSGKSTVAVVVWLVAWAVFHKRWKNTQVNFSGVFVATLILIALGVLGTFPPFFEWFGG
ncbi:MAG TPA: YHS domain-containing protein [Candidatus Tectomicrobia bacterium]|nr:YHS domain-containing protein [Candidatus Tectomicrobia bacterium]